MKNEVSEKKTTKKKSFFILLAVLVLALSCGAGLIFAQQNQVSIAKEEKELRKQFVDEEKAVISLDSEMVITGGTLEVYGNKTLTGTGSLVYDAEGAKNSAMILVHQGASLTVDGVTLDGSQRALYIIQNENGGDVTIQGETVIANAADCNVENEGNFTLAGGTLENPGAHNLHNMNQASLTGGTIAGCGKATCMVVQNEGELVMDGDSIVKDGMLHNIYCASGSEFTMTAGTSKGAASANVYVMDGADVLLNGDDAVLREGMIGLKNYGTAVIEKATIMTSSQTLVGNAPGAVMTIKGGKYKNAANNAIVNDGKLTMTGGEVRNSTKIGLVNSGVATVENTSITNCSYRNVLNEAGGNLTLLEGTILTKGEKCGLYNELGATALIDGAVITDNITNNIYNRGVCEVVNTELSESGSNSIDSSGAGAEMYIHDLTISDTATNHGIFNTNKAVLKLENVTFVNINKRGIQNKGGIVTAKNLIMNGTGGACVGNAAYDDGTYNNVTVDGLTVIQTTSNCINNECEGTTTVKNATFCVTTTNTIKVTKGTLNLSNATLTGTIMPTESAVHGIYITGGNVNIKNCKINNTASRGIQNKGGKVTIDGLTISGSQASALGNTKNDEGIEGTVVAKNMTILDTPSNAVQNECGETSLFDCTLYPSGSNTIKVIKGTIIVDNTKVFGGVSGKNHCLLIEKDGTAIVRNGSELTNRVYRGVSNAGTFYFEGGTIHDCNAGTVSGGGVYNSGLFVMNGGEIKNNYTTSAGGAVSIAAPGEMVLNAGSILNNTATKSGGAVKINDNCKFVMNGGIISGNTSETSHGGGVFVNAGSSLTVAGGVITKNQTPGGGGGAIAAEKTGSVLIQAGEISYNTTGTISKAKDGGAILLTGASSLVMTGGSVVNNSATGQGGAIKREGTGDMTISGGVIANNTSQKNGGAIRITSSKGNLSVSDTAEITNNTAAGNGGAICKDNTGTLIISGGTFKENKATNGSMFYLGNGTLKLNAPFTFDENSEIYLVSGQQLDVTSEEALSDKPIVIDTDNITGGTVIATNSSTKETETVKGYFKLKNSQLELDIAETNIIIKKQELPKMTLYLGDSSNKDENLYTWSDLKTYLEELDVLYNITIVLKTDVTAESTITIKNGMEVTLTDDGNVHTITRGQNFTENFFDVQGLLTIEGSSNIEGQLVEASIPTYLSEIDGYNTASAYVDKIGKVSVILNGGAKLENPIKATRALVVVSSSGTLIVKDGAALVYNNNTTKSKTYSEVGGAVSNSGTFNMNGGVIAYNTTSGDKTYNNYGGAVLNAGTMTVAGGAFYNNEAYRGGAVLVQKGASLTVTGGTFLYNSSSNGGGAIMGYYGNIEFTATEGNTIYVDHNYAAGNGGVAYVYASTLKLNGVSLTYNYAKGSNGGGALCIESKNDTDYCNVEITACTISKNTSAGKKGGGAIYMNAYSQMLINSGAIKENSVSSNTGTEIYAIGTNATVKIKKEVEIDHSEEAVKATNIQWLEN